MPFSEGRDIYPQDITGGSAFNVSFHIKGLPVTNACSRATLSCTVIFSTSELGCVVPSFPITYWANCPQEAQFSLWFQCFEFGKSRIFYRESLACDWKKFRLRKWHLLINTKLFCFKNQLYKVVFSWFHPPKNPIPTLHNYCGGMQ